MMAQIVRVRTDTLVPRVTQLVSKIFLIYLDYKSVITLIGIISNKLYLLMHF